MDNLSRRPFRLVFSKTGQAVFVSHLDVNRAMQRMVRRAHLPVWYTQGFNPHPYLVFHQPLSVGYSGKEEVMDFYLLEDVAPDDILKKIADNMPPGFSAVRVAAPQKALGDISYAGYTVCAEDERFKKEELKEKLISFLKEDQIITEKKSKKGMKTVDIKPLIASWSVEDGAGESVLVKLKAACSQSQNLNPRILLSAFANSEGSEELNYRVTRTAFYDGDMKKFL